MVYRQNLDMKLYRGDILKIALGTSTKTVVVDKMYDLKGQRFIVLKELEKNNTLTTLLINLKILEKGGEVVG